MDTSYGADVASLRHLFFVGHAHELRGARAWHVIETLEAQCGCPLLHILSRKLTGGKPPYAAVRARAAPNGPRKTFAPDFCTS